MIMLKLLFCIFSRRILLSLSISVRQTYRGKNITLFVLHIWRDHITIYFVPIVVLCTLFNVSE